MAPPAGHPAPEELVELTDTDHPTPDELGPPDPVLRDLFRGGAFGG